MLLQISWQLERNLEFVVQIVELVDEMIRLVNWRREFEFPHVFLIYL